MIDDVARYWKSFHLPIPPTFLPFIHLFTHPSTHSSIHLPIYMPPYQPTYLPANLLGTSVGHIPFYFTLHWLGHWNIKANPGLVSCIALVWTNACPFFCVDILCQVILSLSTAGFCSDYITWSAVQTSDRYIPLEYNAFVLNINQLLSNIVY